MFGYPECPYCNKDIDERIGAEWIGDYQMDFETVCPECGAGIDVEVQLLPDFYYHKPSSKQAGEKREQQFCSI